MAFEYTRTSTLAAPSAPTLRVEVDTTAGDAYKSLANLITTAGKTRTEALVAEAKAVGESNYTMVVQNMNAVSRLASIRQKEAGTNIEQQAKIAQSANDDLDTLFAMLDADNRKDLVKFYEGEKNTIQKTFNKAFGDYNVGVFDTNFNAMIPAMMGMDAESLKNILNREYQKGAAVGRTREEIGNSFIEGTSNYAISQMLDPNNNMLQDRDYSWVRVEEQRLRTALEADPNLKNKDKFIAAQKAVNDQRKNLNSLVIGDIKDAIDAESPELFTAAMLIAQEEGVLISDELSVQIIKFEEALLNSERTRRLAAQEMMSKNGGRVVLSGVTDKKLNTLLTTAVNESLTKALVTGEYDAGTEWLKYHAYNNPTQYKEKWSTAFTLATGNIYSILSKSPQDMTEQDVSTLAGYQAKLRMLQGVSFDKMTDEQRLDTQIIDALVSGVFPNTSEAIRIRQSREKVPLINKQEKYVEKLVANVPEDSFADAQRQYSVLRAMGMPDTSAYEIALKNNSFDSIGDNRGEFSGALVNKLAEHDVTGDVADYFESYLIDPEALGLSEKAIEGINTVISGEDVKYQLYQGSLLITNAAGGKVVIPMTEQNWVDFGKGLNKKSNVEYKKSAWNVGTDNAASAFSDTLGDFLESQRRASVAIGGVGDKFVVSPIVTLADWVKDGVNIVDRWLGGASNDDIKAEITKAHNNIKDRLKSYDTSKVDQKRLDEALQNTLDRISISTTSEEAVEILNGYLTEAGFALSQGATGEIIVEDIKIEGAK